jgi:hypothetical protein
MNKEISQTNRSDKEISHSNFLQLILIKYMSICHMM